MRIFDFFKNLDLFESLKTSVETRDELKAFEIKNHFRFDWTKPLTDQNYPSQDVKRIFLNKLKAHIISLRYDIIQYLRENPNVDSKSIKIALSHSYDKNYDKSWSSYIIFSLKQFPKETIQVRISDHPIKLDKKTNLTYFMSVGTFFDRHMKDKLSNFIYYCSGKFMEKYGIEKEKKEPVVVKQTIRPRLHIKD